MSKSLGDHRMCEGCSVESLRLEVRLRSDVARPEDRRSKARDPLQECLLNSPLFYFSLVDNSVPDGAEMIRDRMKLGQSMSFTVSACQSRFSPMAFTGKENSRTTTAYPLFC